MLTFGEQVGDYIHLQMHDPDLSALDLVRRLRSHIMIYTEVNRPGF